MKKEAKFGCYKEDCKFRTNGKEIPTHLETGGEKNDFG